MKKIAALIISLALILALCACGSTATTDTDTAEASSNPTGTESDTDDTVYNWDYLSIISTSNPAMNAIVEFVDEVKEATDGRLVITIREPGELPFTNSEYVRAIGEGEAEMGWGLMPSISGDLTTGSILGLPFLVQDSDDLAVAMSVLQDNIEKELAQYGTGMLFYFNMPAQNLFGQGDAISSFSDASGLQIRSTGSEMADFITSLDAVPVTVDSSEVPTSLSRGVVNSVITSALNCYGSSWNESLDWGYMFNLQADTILTLVNLEALEALPDDLRETLITISDKYTQIATEEIQQEESDAIAALEEGGMTIVEADQSDIDQEVAAFSDYWETWAEDKGGDVPTILESVREALGK